MSVGVLLQNLIISWNKSFDFIKMYWLAPVNVSLYIKTDKLKNKMCPP